VNEVELEAGLRSEIVDMIFEQFLDYLGSLEAKSMVSPSISLDI
jgi:hypothetical protein